jgi:hypothetical protein
MNLWLVFAETLENAEPSEDFRGRIVRIAELSRKVLTFPKNSAVRERSSVPISTLLIICAVTCILLVATWYAARASIRIDRPSSTHDIERLAQDLAANQLKLEQEIDRRQKAEAETGSSGRAAIAKAKSAEDGLLQAQAAIEQLKAAAERNKQQQSEMLTFVNTFERTGARLFPLKATEAAGKGVCYAVYAPNSRLVFIGSNLPPTKDHVLQLWVLRKEGQDPVSAGILPQSENGPSIVHYDGDKSLLSQVSGFLVTEEVIGGDYQKPTGPKLFEASSEESN